MRNGIAIAFAAILLVATTAWAGPVEDFEAAIQSEDMDTRFNAAMASGELGAAALPVALKYWESENPGAQKAARVALPVIVRACQQPGKDDARSEACAILIEATQPGTSDPIRREALFRLGAIADGSHVAAIAPLLKDVAVQEQAAQALENIPHPEAVDALLAALDDAAPGFRVQIMFALAARDVEKAIPAIAAHVTSNDERAAWGAIEALARLGVPPAQNIALPRGASQEERLRYMKATLDAADAQARKGNTTNAEKIYLGVLIEAGAADHLIAFGLTGLAAIDSSKLSGRAISFLGIPGAHAAAMDILVQSEQATVEADLAKAFSNVDASKQCAILRVLDARDSANLGDVIASAGSKDPSVAFEVARIKGTPVVDVDQLLTVAAKGPFFIRADAEAAAIDIAATADTTEAIRIYTALAESEYDGETRLDAIKALGARKGGAAPLTAIVSGKDEDSFRAAAQRALIANAAAHQSPNEAEATILSVVESRVDGSIIDAAVAGMTTIGRGPESVAASLGYLASWKLLGPLTADQVAAVEASVLAGESLSAEGMPEWKDAAIEPWPPIIDFRKHYARHRNMTAFARYAPASGEIAPGTYTLAVGSDDGCVVYVDGVAVITKPEARSYVADQDQVSVKITKPTSSIVIKVMQGDADWRFSARLSPEK